MTALQYMTELEDVVNQIRTVSNCTDAEIDRYIIQAKQYGETKGGTSLDYMQDIKNKIMRGE